jgi:uncharacterized protein (TIGR00730 family)
MLPGLLAGEFQMNIVVYAGTAKGAESCYTDAATELGARIAAEGHTLVYGGGAIGMMGAVSKAALDGGAHVTGVIPAFMYERDWANPRVSDMIVTKDMHERKMKMLELGDVYIALPGGTGTLEEIAEAIAWAGLGLIEGKCFFVNTNGYYNYMEAFFETIRAEGFLRKDNASDVYFVRTIDELFIKIG